MQTPPCCCIVWIPEFPGKVRFHTTSSGNTTKKIKIRRGGTWHANNNNNNNNNNNKIDQVAFLVVDRHCSPPTSKQTNLDRSLLARRALRHALLLQGSGALTSERVGAWRHDCGKTILSRIDQIVEVESPRVRLLLAFPCNLTPLVVAA